MESAVRLVTPHLPTQLADHMSSYEVSLTEDEIDIDKYLATYVPLSNLPTPPPPDVTCFPLTPPQDVDHVKVQGTSPQS